MNLWRHYLRWRHSKGYGVHSPYAYRLITEVLRPGRYGYYAYQQLDKLARPDKNLKSSFIREARFLVRLVIFLKAKRILNTGEKDYASQVVARVMKLVFFFSENQSSFNLKSGDLLVVKGGKLGKDILNEAVSRGTSVFAINPDKEFRQILELPIENGLLLTGRNKIILIPRKEMTYVAYEINI